MKARNGYVSNSSSSSFIVKEDVSNLGISCIKLNKKQLELLKGFKQWEDDAESFEPVENQDYYLTEYIADCCDDWGKVRDMEGAFEYSAGGHGGPYDEEDFNEYVCNFGSVYLRKEHDEAKQMSFNKFAKSFKTDYGNIDVLVKYEKDSIVLIPIRY